MLIDKTLKKKISIKGSANDVWDALVNPSKIKEYLFGTEAQSDWKKGSPLYFRGEWDNKQYEDKGTILEIIPEKLLSYNYWSNFSPLPDVPENYCIIRMEIEKVGVDVVDEVALHLSQQGFANEDAYAHSDSNWGDVLVKIKEIVERKN